LDLRDNLGGVMDASIDLASEFLPSNKLIIYTDVHSMDRKDYHAQSKGNFKAGKLIVLVNKRTASASEILAGALQDWDRGLIIGQSTYGKGLIQQSYLLGDGSAVRLTIGRYYTPTGRHLQRPAGVKQDWLSANLNQLPSSGYTSQVAVPDSLCFSTEGKRTVIGGEGGIIPDIYLASDTSSISYLSKLNNAGLIFEFATYYTHNNRRALLSKYDDGVSLAKDSQLDQELGPAFIKYAKSQVKDEERDLSIEILPPPLHEDVIRSIKGTMGDQLWDRAAFYRVMNYKDPMIQRSISALSDGTFKKLRINE